MRQDELRKVPATNWTLALLGPSDGDLYFDHLMRLDAEDRRFRFFEEPPEFMMALHAGAAASDGRAVLACEAEGEIRAAAELVVDEADPGLGALAFSVERQWRRRGLASALMRSMIDLARARGVSRLELEILPENEAMQALARRFSSVLEVRGDTIVAKIDAATCPNADR
jgi:RimJ/RimL family protein N-acetyltransferase